MKVFSHKSIRPIFKKGNFDLTIELDTDLVITGHSHRNMKVCTKFHENPCKGLLDISLKI